jgi:tetratricopeptide (TPR) repeat protein
MMHLFSFHAALEISATRRRPSIHPNPPIKPFLFGLILSVWAALINGMGVSTAGAAEAPLATGQSRPAPDLTLLAKEARWLELQAAASDVLSLNAADIQAIAHKIKALRMTGALGPAMAQADAALAHFPEEGAIRLERAWVLVFQGKWPEALVEARRAAATTSALSESLLVQGIAYRELRDWDNMLSAFSRLHPLRPEDSIASLNIGRAYIEKGLWKEAIISLDQSIRLDPKAPEAYVFRGQAHTGSGMPAEAMHDCNYALKLDPRLAAAYIVRAEVLAQSGNWEAAAKDAYTAIILGAQDGRPFLTACQASLALGDWKALGEYATGGIIVAPDNVAFHHFAGRAYREQGELDKAIAAYDTALTIAPRQPMLLLEHAAVCMMLRRYDQAAQDCNAALAVEGSATAYAMRGFLRLKTGDSAGAFEDSTNALTLEPKTVSAWLVRANIHLARGKVAAALSESRKALQLDPAQAWGYVTYGSALLADSRAQEAVPILDQAVLLSPNDGEAHLARGRCFIALGRLAEGRKDIEAAMAHDPALAQVARAELDKLGK